MEPELVSEETAFGRRWRPALMAFFLRRVRDHAEAEDLTQEVFVRLIAKDYAESDRPDAYVFQVAANLLRDRARRAKVRADYRDMARAVEDQGLDPIDPHQVVEGRAAIATLLNGLDALPERTRVIFTLYRIENVDLDSIAESFGISKSAVKKHVHKAMVFLMARMRSVR